MVCRWHMLIEGVVQGVGFRPFVYQQAVARGLTGWVRNDGRGVTVEVQGPPGGLESFQQAVRRDAPPLSHIHHLECAPVEVVSEQAFTIVPSTQGEVRTTHVSPDAWVCRDCLDELFDPDNRRHRYPFINCTHCGPRFSLITAIPYDRPQTTMADFTLCPACQQEYDDPQSRRFHAQPNACPDCGPRIVLTDRQGGAVSTGDPVAEVVRLLEGGAIVAIKGIGGFHLAVDPRHDQALQRLRTRKLRDEKPFALMARDLDAARSVTRISAVERALLESVERPIVILDQKPAHGLSRLIAPGLSTFGIMLPYTPLHFLLLDTLPLLVMTSANVSDEPIVHEDQEAVAALGPIADYILGHNRRIHIRTDDSIVRVIADQPRLLRRSRGFVPRMIPLPQNSSQVLALGGEIKNAICLTRDDGAFLSQHIGDLTNCRAIDAFGQSVDHLRSVLEMAPEIVAFDLHPDYHSTRSAGRFPDLRGVPVQHHHAHMASCMAENGLVGEVIGVIFDGIGYGTDGTLWGGEFLIGGYDRFKRGGHFRPIAMPGGDAATREPYRMAISYLTEAYGRNLPPVPLLEQIGSPDLKLLLAMISKGINSPMTTSCGRLFDAVAALAGLRRTVSYEGQAAIELEAVLDRHEDHGSYPFTLSDGPPWQIDFAPLVRGVVNDVLQERGPGVISHRFHRALVEAVLGVCLRLRKDGGGNRVVLSGGVFQNRYLTETCLESLTGQGFEVFTHRLVPSNDGGLALGQAVVAGCQPQDFRRS